MKATDPPLSREVGDLVIHDYSSIKPGKVFV
jgi:hypothetical protein